MVSGIGTIQSVGDRDPAHVFKSFNMIKTIRHKCTFMNVNGMSVPIGQIQLAQHHLSLFIKLSYRQIFYYEYL